MLVHSLHVAVSEVAELITDYHGLVTLDAHVSLLDLAGLLSSAAGPRHFELPDPDRIPSRSTGHQGSATSRLVVVALVAERSPPEIRLEHPLAAAHAAPAP
jgi:hypothetical protein